MHHDHTATHIKDITSNNDINNNSQRVWNALAHLRCTQALTTITKARTTDPRLTHDVERVGSAYLALIIAFFNLTQHRLCDFNVYRFITKYYSTVRTLKSNHCIPTTHVFSLVSLCPCVPFISLAFLWLCMHL